MCLLWCGVYQVTARTEITIKPIGTAPAQSLGLLVQHWVSRKHSNSHYFSPLFIMGQFCVCEKLANNLLGSCYLQHYCISCVCVPGSVGWTQRLIRPTHSPQWGLGFSTGTYCILQIPCFLHPWQTVTDRLNLVLRLMNRSDAHCLVLLCHYHRSILLVVGHNLCSAYHWQERCNLLMLFQWTCSSTSAMCLPLYSPMGIVIW